MSPAKVMVCLCIVLLTTVAHAQYGTPASLQAELKPGDDLVYASTPQTTVQLSTLDNALYVPASVQSQPGQKHPALILFHTCGGICEHIQYWAQEALKEGYVVLTPNGMRGLRSDCGSPSQIPNARFLKNTLDGATHLAKLPYVDAQRIGVVGFSKGAFVATWLSSPSVAQAIDPSAPRPAATHCWDCKEKDGFSKIALNGQRVTYRFDAAVTQDSRERVFGFLGNALRVER